MLHLERCYHLAICVYIYIYTYIHTYIHTYIYMEKPFIQTTPIPSDPRGSLCPRAIYPCTNDPHSLGPP